MQTGARFWQLIGVVMLILGGYALAELHDAVQARQKQLESQRQLLFRQQALLHETHWLDSQRQLEQLERQWNDYLPTEESATVAKAHLLSEMRTLAQKAGIQNLSVSATDAEGAQAAKPGATTRTGAGARSTAKAAGDELPAGVQVIKLRINGRFEPAAFAKLLHALELGQQFSVVERVSVRGAQLEVGIRCYRRFGAAPAPRTDSPASATL